MKERTVTSVAQHVEYQVEFLATLTIGPTIGLESPFYFGYEGTDKRTSGTDKNFKIKYFDVCYLMMIFSKSMRSEKV